jgi:metacaspase-1
LKKIVAIEFISLMMLTAFCLFPARAEDRALVIGVDIYADQRLSPTDGATDDARAMQKLLIEKFKFAPGAIKILLNEQAAARSISQNFQTWLIDGTRPGDRVFFFYAGHGFQAPDDNGDEEDKMDEVVTPYDVVIASEKGKVVLKDERTFIRDDKFNDFIAQLSGRRVVLMFDSCHSGTISRGLENNSKILPSRYLRLKPARGIGDGGYSEVPTIGQPRDLTTIREDSLNGNINGVVVLSAASPYQQAFPFVTENNQTRGAFSYIFEQLIRRNAAENLTTLEKNLKLEMKSFADRKIIGVSSNGEFQVPQIDIISKTALADKPLFAASSPDEDYTAAVESALFNPLSTLKVKLELGKSRYKIGESINYTVDVSENLFLYILVFSTQNKAFCLFPAAVGGDIDNFVRKGKIVFPRDNYVTEATEPVGKDVWVALVSRKKLNLGEKQEYTWDEMFKRIGLEDLRKAIYGKTRGAGNKQNSSLTADDWQADSIIVETVN